MTDDRHWDEIPPFAWRADTKLSDCPFAPSDPKWKEWQHSFLEYNHVGDQQKVDIQVERMARVKESMKAQRRDKQDWHDGVMREVESHNHWVEQGQGQERWVTNLGRGLRGRVLGVKITPLSGTGRLSQRDPQDQRFFRPSLGQYQKAWDPITVNDDPLSQYFQDMAAWMNTSPDHVSDAVDALAGVFSTFAKTAIEIIEDILDALRVKQERQELGRGWLPEGWAIWDIEEPGHDWVWDIRWWIAITGWLQYDAI